MMARGRNEISTAESPRPSDAPIHHRGVVARVVRESFWSYAAQGASLLTSLAVTPFLIRYLGAADYGLLTLISVLIGYLGFTDLGMGVASTKFGAEAVARGDERGESAVVWTSMLVTSLPVLAFAVILMCLGRPLLEKVFALPLNGHMGVIPALRIAALVLLVSAVTGVFNTSQLVRMKVGINSAISVCARVGQAAFTMIVLLMGGRLISVVCVIAGAALVTAALNVIASARLAPIILRPVIDRRLIAPLLRFGAAVVASAAIGTIVVHGEKLLLVRMASVTSLAYYSVAATLAGLLGMIPGAISVPLMPSLIHLRVAKDLETSQRVYNSMLRLLIFSTIPAGLILCVGAKGFITVWAGSDFGRESPVPLCILVVGWLFHAVSYVPRNVLPAHNHVGLLPRYQALEFIPYFLVCVFLIPRFGIAGAALAWMLRVMTEAFLLFRATRRLCGLKASPLGGNQAMYLLSLAALLLPVSLSAVLAASQRVVFAVTAVAVGLHVFLLISRVLTEEEKVWMKHYLLRRTRG